MNLHSFSLRRPVTVVIAAFAVLVFAFIAVDRLNTNLLPDFNYPSITVAAIYENADPDTVESMVTVELERLLRSVVGVKSVNSTSVENASICQVVFEWGTDLVVAEQNIKTNIERLKLLVPEDVGEPVILKFDTSSVPILMLTVGSSGDIGDVTEQLYQTVKPSIERIPGVAGVSIIGAADKVINVIYDQDALNEAGLTSSLLQQYIAYQNLSIPAGSITEDGVRYNIKVGSKLQTTEDIEDLIIGMNYNDPGQSGLLGIGLMMQPLTIWDIAEVEETYAEQEGITRVGGKPAISLTIYGQPDASPVSVSKDVNAALEDLRISNPDLEIGIVFDQANFINKSIGDIIQNILFGAIFAVAVILLFLKNIKSTLIIAVSIPLSILVAIVGMLVFDQTLNLMTLGGLALGIGMIVDNSIVVLDSIYRRMEYGDDPYHAALNGTKEVISAIFASTMTTVVIFVPLIFIQGFVSAIFTSLAITVIFAIIASLLVALTIVPLMASKLLKKKDIKIKVEKEIQTDKGTVIEGSSNKLYKKALNWSLKNPLAVFGAIVALLIVAALILPSIGFGLLPKIDMGRIDVNFSLPNGAALSLTDEVAQLIENKILELDDIENITTTVGSASSGDIASMVSGAASNNGSFSIIVKNDHKLSLEDLGNEIRRIIQESGEEHPDVEEISCSVNVTGLGKITSSDSFDIFSTSVAFEIYGNEIDVLMDLAAQVEEKFLSEEMFIDILNQAKFSQPVLRLEVNRARALLGGLTVGQIGLGVSNSVLGIEATSIERNGESIPVIIKPKTAENMTLEDLLQLPISASLDGIVAGGGSLSSLMGGSSAIGGSGDSIILERVVSPQEEEGSFNITRKNGVRYTTVSASYVNVNQSQANKRALEIINDIEIPEGYTIQFGGSNDLMNDAMGDLTLIGLLAILFIYMVMAIQYESFLDPLIIMVTLPLAVIGAIIFIKLWGLEMGITAIIGLIVLIGVVVNNAILMVDYINQIRATGVKTKEAVVIASEARVRPVLMTAITIIAGLIPMVLGIGKGSELQTPMGVIFSGGMIFSTFLTLFVVPTLYLIMHNFVDRFKRKEV